MFTINNVFFVLLVTFFSGTVFAVKPTPLPRNKNVFVKVAPRQKLLSQKLLARVITPEERKEFYQHVNELIQERNTELNG